MGKGGGSAHTPVEAKDSLFSSQQLSIIDMLCEGEIEGIVGGFNGVLLNDTPVQTKDGNYNFKNLECEWVVGTQAQEPLAGFPSTESEIPVSLEVKFNTPIVRTITDKNVDRVRVTVGVSALYKQENNGDINGSSCSLSIQIGEGNNWRTVETVEFNGKTRSQYLKSVILTSLPTVPFNIRVVRLTEDSDSSLISNGSLWSSYTEIYDIKLAYPNTALVGIKFDSDQFSGVPSRKYRIKGMIVKVPDNYDPETRSYSGIWLGGFKTAWTDNPAWVLYDLVTNKRYGLGRKIASFGVDKFALYTIAQYCDQLVDDGFGNKEPRFTCNAYITEQRQAYDVISDLCSIFRAMPVWNGTQLTAIMDRKADLTAIYNNSNVVDGSFSYSSSAQKDRHTAVHVRYTDKDNSYETSTEYVADDDLIARFGLNVSQVDAFGCTTRSQAHRVGKWIIQTEKLEKQTVTFSVGREGLKHLPGDIIGVADNDYAGAKIGGRIIKAENRTITLDRAVKISGVTTITYTDSNSDLVEVKVMSQISETELLVESDVKADSYSVWMMKSAEIAPRLFKALSVAENDGGTYSITALQHVPEKESIVDDGATFEKDNNTLYTASIPPVEHLQAELMPESDNYQVLLTWSTPRTIDDLQFEVKVFTDNKLKSRMVVSDTNCYISDLEIGTYSATVRGITSDGKLGDDSAISFSVAPPAKPDELSLNPSAFSVSIRPVTRQATSLGTQYEFYKGTTKAEVEQKLNYMGRAMTMIDADCKSETEYWYGVNTINAVGRSDMTIGNTKTLIAENGAGGTFRIQTKDGKFPTDDEATQMFVNEFGFYPARDTTLIIYSLDGNGVVTNSEAKMYNGSRWIEPALFLDGDLIATGTIRGDRIVAGAEITAPKITGGTITAGNVVSSGTPPSFELTADGILTARKANISGEMYATKGTMDNVVINETCTIKKLRVDQLEGDVSKSYTLKSGEGITIPAVDYNRELFIPSVICSCSSYPIYTAMNNGFGHIIITPGSGPYSAASAVVNIDGSNVINISVASQTAAIVKQASYSKTIQKNQSCTVKFTSTASGTTSSTQSSILITVNRS